MNEDIEARIEAIRNDPTVKTAVLGKQVEEFLASPVGNYLLKRSVDEHDEAVELLKRMSPHDWQGVQALQNRIQVADQFQRWLGDAVSEGQKALSLIEEE